MNSCSVRREQENSLDQNIAMRLIQNNLEDGSCLVRRELFYLVIFQATVRSTTGIM